MSVHPSEPEMKAFCAKALAPEEAAAIATHLAECRACLGAYREGVGQGRRGGPAGSSVLGGHLTEEQVSVLASPETEAGAEPGAKAHLAACARCRAEVEDLADYRRRLAHETRLRFRAPSQGAPLRASRRAALAAALLVAAIGAAFLLASYHRLYSAGGAGGQVAEINPSPGPERVEPSVADPSPSPSSSPGEKAADESAIIDGPHRVRLDGGGRLEGLDGVGEKIRERVRLALVAGRLEMPPGLAEFLPRRSALRGRDPDAPLFRLTGPRGVVAKARPTFGWTPAPGAISYRVVVADSEGRAVARSDALPGGVTRWVPAAPLRPGEVYSWMVFAEVAGETLTAPTPADPEAKFKLLDPGAAALIERIRAASSSRLALAVAYADAGMREEAGRELEALRRENPRSPLVARLLRSLKSWRD